MPSANKNNNKIPHSASQARSWVNDLPLTNMGEVTKRLYKTLIALNQQPLPAQVRIDIGDVLLPFVSMSLDNLNRHFSSRSFPLLDRSQKVFDLKQALQLELSGLYQLATIDMLTKGPLVPKKLLISIGRSIKYMSGTLINSYSIYNKNKANVWHDVHQLYLFACENNIQLQAIPDKSDAQAEKLSIEEHYLFVHLIALSIPNSLRQGEITRLESFYKQIISQVKIVKSTDNITSKYAHIALLNSDEPAALMPVSDIVSSATSRIIDTSNIIDILNNFIVETTHSTLRLNKNYPMLNHGLAKRLTSTMTNARSRKHKRFERDDKAGLVIRLKDVIEVVRCTQTDSVVLENAEEDEVYDQLNFGETVASPWSDLGVETLEEEHDVEIQTWKIKNSSASGYGLCQHEKEQTSARIGEIVGIKDPADDSDQWQILVIRWMDYYRGKKGLCFGAELLSSKAMSIRIDTVENRKLTQTLPVEGLFFPSIEGVHEEPRLILPGHMFKVEDILTLQFSAREEKIQLMKIDECVGVFAYCHFKVVENKQVEEKEDNFDEVWDFI
ncbi:MAG: hypothetical protein KAG34_05155 [Cocleimonas sp.]|nr:hypothetical protein [Cocleimonas sp.]